MEDQRFQIGHRDWSDVGGYFEGFAASCSVLLVTGRGMFSECGAEAELAAILKGKRVRRVSDFDTNPKTEDVVRLLDELRAEPRFDVIVAVGGGSVIDVAKLLKAFWASREPVVGYLDGDEALVPADIPLIAIPTTAGSGSEATHFAVLFCGNEKYSIADERLRPDAAFLIPELLESVPQMVAAASGMDALCQGIESYWSVASTEASQALAAEAIRLAWRALRPAVLKGDRASLAQMSRASHLAGKAIDLTKTTAAHAASYPFSSIFGVQHGHAVGLLVAEFFAYNAAVTEADCLDPRGAQAVRDRLGEIAELLGCRSPQEAGVAVRELVQRLGLETDLRRLGISGDPELDRLLRNGFNPERVSNNPRRVTESGLRGVLQSLHSGR